MLSCVGTMLPLELSIFNFIFFSIRERRAATCFDESQINRKCGLSGDKKNESEAFDLYFHIVYFGLTVCQLTPTQSLLSFAYVFDTDTNQSEISQPFGATLELLCSKPSGVHSKLFNWYDSE